MSSTWDVPQRYLQLSLYAGRSDPKKDAKILSFLDVRAKVSFNTSETVSGAVNETNLTIYGLTKDKMLYLATSTSAWNKQAIYNQLIVDAGYDNNHGVIFDGNVIEATPSLASSDYHVKLKALSSFYTLDNDIVSLSYAGKTDLKIIVQEIAKRLGAILQYQVSTPIFITDYSLSNANLIQHMRNLAGIAKLDIWMTHNYLVVKTRGSNLESFKSFKIDVSNMIGSPQPTSLGCNVDIRLNPAVLTGQAVILESVKFPELNSSKYVIQTINHAGDTRGNNWLTHLTLIRKDIYDK